MPHCDEQGVNGCSPGPPEPRERAETLDVSIIIPAYNAHDTLPLAVSTAIEHLSRMGCTYEVIIAEDGSTDGTDEVARELSCTHENVVHLHSEERLGRGRALARAIELSHGDVVMYMDADLATHPSHIRELVESVLQGCDVATGSRLVQESSAQRSTGRLLASVVFNTMVRVLLGSRVHDHQCGFKAFRRERILPLLRQVRDAHWFWDTEVLVRAQHRGMRVCEIPVRWREGTDTRVSFARDIPYMAASILRLFWQMRLSGRLGLKGRLILSVCLMALIFFAMLSSVDATAVASAIGSASLGVLVLASLVYASSYLVRGMRYSHILSCVGVRLGTLFLSEVVYISQLANLVLPMRLGDLTRMYVLKRIRGVSLPDGFSSVAIERIYDVMALGVLGVLGLLSVSTAHRWMLYLTLTALGLCIVAVIVLHALSHSQLAERLAGTLLFRHRGAALKVLGDVARTSTHPATLARLLLLSLGIWAFDVATCALVLLSLGVGAGMGLVALAVAMANIVKVVPLTPGGIGQYEAALAAVLALGGFPLVVCISGAILDHLIKNVITLLVGGTVFTRYNLRWKELAALGDAA
ncbi:MAG: glycosyltransferase AglD [Methanosarcinales archaeon]|uniref:flippase-like domain-containing protein n=1 Tax=Methermicoccus shengliensis TaxID=660064 RepID=UPI000693D7EA|nr:flippase-like domain-containing protein [Methermicoccus shengliensis]MDI3487853.1 glycosyltransferase AglD [Methanosarcinales archaeon]